VRFGFVINGQVFIAHEQNHANLIESVYMTTANLPVRYEIENVGVPASNGTFEPICSSVISEGGFEEERAYQFSDVSAALTVTTTTTPLVAIRQKATFNSIVSRGLVLPISLEALTTGTGSAIWELIFVPHSGSVVGGAWASVGASSICDVNKTATSLTGGIVVESGFYTSTVQAKSGIQRGLSLRAPMGWNHDATTYSSWVLAARTITGTLATLGSLTWKEIR
jgi:hypothetical protein